MDLRPKLIDVYIVKKFITTFFVALLLIIGIVIIFDISEKIDDFVSKEAPLKAIIFDYYVNFVPYFMNMKNKKWADDFSPLDPKGTSFVDHTYTKAYVRHLFVAGEIFAGQIASEHNLAFYLDLVREARKHIKLGDFKAWKDETVRRITTRL